MTDTTTFAGTDTTGTAAGTFSCNVAVDPQTLAPNEALNFEFTFNAAATTTLKLYGAEVTFA